MADDTAGVKGWLKKCSAAMDTRSLRTAAITFFLFWFLFDSVVWLALSGAFLALSMTKKTS